MAQGDLNFAWINETDVFDQVIHRRFDEEVEEAVLTADEDGFATSTLKVRPPEGGMLKITRKVWAFASIEMADGSLQLWWKGKVDSFPLGGDPEEATLSFKCAPSDWSDRQLLVLEATKSDPHWDPALVDPNSLDDPTEILDGQSRVICFHPATHDCELHDIFGVGLDVVDVGLNWFEDSLTAQITEPPIEYVDLTVTAKWTQQISGSFSLDDAIETAFDGSEPATLTPDDFISHWPRQGDGVSNNNGYTVSSSSLTRIYPTDSRPLKQTFQGADTAFAYITDANLKAPMVRVVPMDIAYFDATMGITWSAEQPRTETFTLRLLSGVQDTSLGNGGGRTLDLTCQDITVDNITEAWAAGVSYDVGHLVRQGSRTWTRLKAGVSAATWSEDFTYLDSSTFPPTLRQNWNLTDPDQSPLGGIGKSKYFPTVRGSKTLLAALLKARAMLAESQRCIEITFEMPLMDAIVAGIYLGKVIRLTIPPGRLAIEGNTVEGKVSSYTMTTNASDDVASITIKCACGSGKSSTVSGTWASQTSQPWDVVAVPDLSSLTPVPMATGGIRLIQVNNTLDEQTAYVRSKDFNPDAGRSDKDATNPETLLKDVPTGLVFNLVPLAAQDDLTMTYNVTLPVRFEGPRQVDFGAPL